MFEMGTAREVIDVPIICKQDRCANHLNLGPVHMKVGDPGKVIYPASVG